MEIQNTKSIKRKKIKKNQSLPKNSLDYNNEKEELQVTKISPAEERKLNLLFAFLTNPKGLTKNEIELKIIQYKTKSQNQDKDESLNKKIQRDLADLRDMGFDIQFEDKKYKLKSSPLIKPNFFSPDELKAISIALFHYGKKKNFSANLYSLCQKLFGSNWKDYPYFPKYFNYLKDLNSPSEVLDKLIQAIKSQKPISMVYTREYGNPKTKQIFPLSIIRKNGLDFYLYAFDIEKNQYRYYIIPCIESCRILNKEVNLPSQTKYTHSTSLDTIHPLNFKVENEITCKIKITKDVKEHFLSFIPKSNLISNKDSICFTITNLTALYPLLLKFKDFILEIQPPQIKDGFKEFLKIVINSHKL